ncbi:DUF2993 domain-containing protein [Actinomadura craniellae]|uniref:DUF2993 domain-containing protein n=1 Tax=Actinomadura craniellae TaxID=2231787 RepID=A0A365GXA7_9ACTN|nr:DUF2993 domain-containing protein [Actinomadura craniellae]RAY11469.1 DUF2993 domain-containing protein [Actinomadura craniellae]
MRKVLVVFLILLVGGALVADRLAVNRAEAEIGRQIATQYNLTTQPDVTIHGFPFLTQAIGGEYDQIDVAIGDWTDQGIEVKDVRAEMHGVSAPLGDVVNGDTSGITVRTAVASAVVPFEALKKRAPQGVRSISAKGPDVQVEGNIAMLGVSADVTMVVSVRATAQGIAITPRSVGASGTGVQVPLSLVRQRLSWTVPIRDLPVGSRISKVEVTPTGLRVSATAENVKLNDLENA